MTLNLGEIVNFASLGAFGGIGILMQAVVLGCFARSAMAEPVEVGSAEFEDWPVSQLSQRPGGGDTSSDDDGLPDSGPFELQGQGVLFQEAWESSGRLRGTIFYPFSDSFLLGAEADLAFGDAFAEPGEIELKLNEFYAAYAPGKLPELRFVAGLIDLTSYFDRNSFAKDKTTHFFNSVFETNLALGRVGLDSKPGVLVNWTPVDAVEFKAAGFSSSRELEDFEFDSMAVEAGLRWGNGILRGTYGSGRDGGRGDGFDEIFQFDRGDDRFGLKDSDREVAYGINGEFFIPDAQLGLFGRYGYYRNLKLDEGGDTYSFGVNWFDVGRSGSRLGVGYGRGLSQDALRRDRGDRRPDVLELFYDFPLRSQTRAAVSLQEREEFSETVLGLRVKTQF